MGRAAAPGGAADIVKKVSVPINSGEWNPDYSMGNERLNSIAQELGMNTRFNTSTGCYDSIPNRDRYCEVEEHYLTYGVTNLWDAATDTFVSGWESYARPLAYINEAPTLPWILEEDTLTAGSRIAVHDCNLMGEEYNDEWDTIPEYNFQFVHNLCTIFPQ